ncbi:hypothetical protein KFK09_025843 [Dendrobium nobile]|uniref:Uncharacterized protein n=1 Tax=Dendrobium nobile TaxID=94219 RepID=A0A8T3A669_DENNO|nr:hypothetical protein KFK09_025843 [Dendrobium nobile]
MAQILVGRIRDGDWKWMMIDDGDGGGRGDIDRIEGVGDGGMKIRARETSYVLNKIWGLSDGCDKKQRRIWDLCDWGVELSNKGQFDGWHYAG